MSYYEKCLKAWANWHGQRGTEKQLKSLRKTFPESMLWNLERVLAERNILPAKEG